MAPCFLPELPTTVWPPSSPSPLTLPQRRPEKPTPASNLRQKGLLYGIIQYQFTIQSYQQEFRFLHTLSGKFKKKKHVAGITAQQSACLAHEFQAQSLALVLLSQQSQLSLDSIPSVFILWKSLRSIGVSCSFQAQWIQQCIHLGLNCFL